MLLLVLFFPLVLAHSEYRSYIPNGFNVPGSEGVGHVHIHGGGPHPYLPDRELNPFGLDFRAEGFKWTTRLCRLDSDQDGESNGLELGDPCCEWTEGASATRRPYRISHPGKPVKPTHCCGAVVATTGLNMPDCAALTQHQKIDVQVAAALESFVDSDSDAAAGFWEFYFQDVGSRDGEGPRKTTLTDGYIGGASILLHGGQNIGTCVILLEVGPSSMPPDHAINCISQWTPLCSHTHVARDARPVISVR